MLSRACHIFAITALLLAGAALSGCTSINERAGAAMGDYIPQWAGGLPADAPPRPGTAKYDEFMRERERKRLMPAAEREKQERAQQQQAAPSSSDAIH